LITLVDLSSVASRLPVPALAFAGTSAAPDKVARSLSVWPAVEALDELEPIGMEPQPASATATAVNPARKRLEEMDISGLQ
jgi:hypothetical protein